MTNIRETISTALGGNQNYLRVAEPAITALEQREQTIIEALRSFARDQGLDDSQVQHALVTVGLVEEVRWVSPADSSQDAQQGTSDLSRQVQDLARMVEQLQQAARRAGVQV